MSLKKSVFLLILVVVTLVTETDSYAGWRARARRDARRARRAHRVQMRMQRHQQPPQGMPTPPMPDQTVPNPNPNDPTPFPTAQPPHANGTGDGTGTDYIRPPDTSTPPSKINAGPFVTDDGKYGIDIRQGFESVEMPNEVLHDSMYVLGTMTKDHTRQDAMEKANTQFTKNGAGNAIAQVDSIDKAIEAIKRISAQRSSSSMSTRFRSLVLVGYCQPGSFAFSDTASADETMKAGSAGLRKFADSLNAANISFPEVIFACGQVAQGVLSKRNSHLMKELSATMKDNPAVTAFTEVLGYQDDKITSKPTNMRITLRVQPTTDFPHQPITGNLPPHDAPIDFTKGTFDYVRPTKAEMDSWHRKFGHLPFSKGIYFAKNTKTEEVETGGHVGDAQLTLASVTVNIDNKVYELKRPANSGKRWAIYTGFLWNDDWQIRPSEIDGLLKEQHGVSAGTQPVQIVSIKMVHP